MTKMFNDVERSTRVPVFQSIPVRYRGEIALKIQNGEVPDSSVGLLLHPTLGDEIGDLTKTPLDPHTKARIRRYSRWSPRQLRHRDLICRARWRRDGSCRIDSHAHKRWKRLAWIRSFFWWTNPEFYMLKRQIKSVENQAIEK